VSANFARRAAAAMLAAVALVLPAWAVGLAHRIAMKDVAFEPAEAAVHVGDGVAWANGDIVAHTATSEAGGFDVNVPPGGQGSAVMTRPGTFNYLCRYHPNMAGRIVVER
jgi:plastocyanin